MIEPSDEWTVQQCRGLFFKISKLHFRSEIFLKKLLRTGSLIPEIKEQCNKKEDKGRTRIFEVLMLGSTPLLCMKHWTIG
jgi:hypothetical protein